jgi:hypothetical protein
MRATLSRDCRVGQGALLRPAPLRTGRAAFTASGSSKPLRLAGRQKCCAAAGADGSALAIGVYETGFDFVRCAVLPHHDVLLDQRFAGGRQPLFPLARALRRAVGVQKDPWQPRCINSRCRLVL